MAGDAHLAQPASDQTEATSNHSPPREALDLAAKIFDLARNGSTSELLSYLSAGIPLNLRNHKGDSLLMLAAYHGHAETVRALLDQGADPDLLNDRGQSPIAGAVFKGNDAVIKVLIEGVRGRKADLYAGQPNAVDSSIMFKRQDYLDLFGVSNGQS